METQEPTSEPAPRDLGKEIRSHIETLLHRRTTVRQSRRRAVEDVSKRALDSLWHLARRHPYLSALTIGAAIATTGASFGVTEFALGVVATYGALEVLKGRASVEQVFGQFVHDRA